jgi:hypothetical protein
MAGSDELIYRIKFETDESSKESVKQSLKDLREEQEKAASSKLNESLKETIEVQGQFTEENLKTIERLVELRKQIDSYRESLSEIRKAKRDDIDLTDAQREKEVEIRASLKEASQAYRDNQKELIANTTSVDGATVSYNQLASETKLLEQQLRKLPIDEESEEFKGLQKQIGQNREEMKKFNADIGDHSMNVGNYSEAMSTAASALASFEGPLGPIAGRLNSINTTMKRAIPIIKAKTAAWSALRIAIMSTGIGLLIVGLGTLIAALRTIQPVVDEVTKRFQQLGAIWGYARDRIGWLLGMNEMSNFSLMESIRITGELADAERALEDARINSTERLAELQSDIAMLRRDAEDESLSHRERMRRMDDAIAKTEEEFRIKREFAEEEVRIAERRASIARNERSDNKEVAETRAALVKLQGEQAMSERQLLRRRQSIINSLETEENRRRKNIQSIRDEAQALEDAFRERVLQYTNDPTETLAEQRHRRMVALYEGLGENRLAIELKANRDVDKARQESEQKIKEAYENREERETALMKKLIVDGVESEKARGDAIIEIRKRIEEEIEAIEEGKRLMIKAIREQESADTNAILDEEIKNRNNVRAQIQQLEKESAIRNMALQSQIRGEANRQLLVLEEQKEMRRLELLREYRELEFTEEQAQQNSRRQAELEFEENIQKTKTAIRQAELQNRLDMEQAYADLTFGVLSTLFQDAKGVQVATAIADTYVAANKALASAPPPLSTIRAAAAVAMGLANVRKIMKAEPGDKPSGSGGGSQQAALSSQRGFEVLGADQDEGAVARQVAEMGSSSDGRGDPTFIFKGDLDSEIMAIKVRQGNRTINTKSVITNSRS